MKDSNENQEGVECGVRDKYAKPWKVKEERSFFQLYTTYSKPGLVSIFYNEDQRSFHNWGLEVGSGPKRGRIREAIDHQINTPVLEIAGDHNGSVYMVCPPDKKSTINVDMPYVTMLMKDMHGYSSVEFTVLDTLGFSRKICAKNFKSRCTIGELNCEIPMRLSPTWNYACVNLDDTLRNAFGTKLVSVQRIKINANVRVRRIYFHEEIFGFRSLPQEFRIKLVLTPQEKQEIHMYEEFLHSVPTTSPERNIPWAMPRLMITRPSGFDYQVRRSINRLHTTLRRRVEILEVPLVEDDEDKYSNVGGIQTHTNTGLLRDMLQKSIPPSKILLPTLSLIYPDKKGQEDAAAAQAGKIDDYLKKKGHKEESKFFGRPNEYQQKMENACEGASASVDDKMEHLRKMKKCIEAPIPPVDTQDEPPNQTVGSVQAQTDWEKFHDHTHHDHHHHHSHHHTTDRDSHQNSRPGSPEPHNSATTSTSSGGSPRSEHHHHHSPHSCGKYTVTDLANYLKHRELFGDYDMFSSNVGNTRFLMAPGGEIDIVEPSSDDDSENNSTEVLLDRRSTHGENPFVHNRPSSPPSPSVRVSRAEVNFRRSTVSRIALQDPAKYADEDAGSLADSGLHLTESWLLTWAYNEVGWARSREINQKLLNDARIYYATEHENKKSRKSIVEAGLSLQLQNQQQPQGTPPTPTRYQRVPQKLPENYRSAVPMLPKVMKEELRGTGGYYDIIVDNPTLPIDHF